LIAKYPSAKYWDSFSNCFRTGLPSAPGAALLRELQGKPIKVMYGIDPLLVLGTQAKPSVRSYV
jgi:hypothetical protein